MQTSEEFFREKIKEEYPFQHIITLSTQLINSEQAMRWSQEYSLIKAKFHVSEALKQASEKLTDMYIYNQYADDILKAYSLDNVR